MIKYTFINLRYLLNWRLNWIKWYGELGMVISAEMVGA